MTISTLRLPVDSWVDQAAVGRNHGSGGTLYMSSAANAQRYAYLSFAGLPPANASIFSAILSVWIGPVAWGGPTITVRRLSERWSESGVTWSNKPASVATHAVTTPGISGADGTRVDIDVTALVVDALAAGQRFGFRLESSTAAVGGRSIYSSEAGNASRRPILTVDWTTAPTVATDLWPSGGNAVSKAAPFVGWSYRDLQGDAQATYRVQVDDATDFATPLFDSGVVNSSDPQADLAALGWAGLADGATAYFRVKVTDSYGTSSPYSDPSQFSRKVKGTVAISAPGAVIQSDTPSVVHTFTPPSGAAQQSVRYRVERQLSDGSYLLTYDSGRRTTVATTFEIPAGAIRVDQATYRISVDVWDTVARASTPGDPPSVRAQVVTRFDSSGAAPPVPTGVVAVAELAGGVGVKLSWSLPSIPDGFSVLDGGVVVASRLDPLAVQTGPTSYEWIYYGAEGYLDHDFRVMTADENAGAWTLSPKSAAAHFTPRPVGIWLVDDSARPAPAQIRLLGTDPPALVVGESSEVYEPVGRSDPVIVRDSMRGLEGSTTGVLESPADYDALAELVAGAVVARYAVGRLNIPVRLRALSYSPFTLDSDATGVSLEVYQVGEFE